MATFISSSLKLPLCLLLFLDQEVKLNYAAVNFCYQFWHLQFVWVKLTMPDYLLESRSVPAYKDKPSATDCPVQEICPKSAFYCLVPYRLVCWKDSRLCESQKYKKLLRNQLNQVEQKTFFFFLNSFKSHFARVFTSKGGFCFSIHSLRTLMYFAVICQCHTQL